MIGTYNVLAHFINKNSRSSDFTTSGRKECMEYLGLAGFLLGVVVLNKYGPLYSYQRCIEALFLVLCTALPMIVFHIVNTALTTADAAESEVATATATTTTEPLVFLQSLLTRSLGMVATVACVFFFYWLFDEYHSSFMSGFFGIDDRERPPPHEPQRSQDNKPHLHNFFALGGLLRQYVSGPVGFAACALAYLCLSHYVLKQPQDGYYELGKVILNLPYAPPSSLYTTIPCRQHLLECLVRCFYAPLMFTSLCDNLTLLHYRGFEDDSYMAFWRFANNLIFSVDLCFAFIGYAFPFSLLLGTHIRSVEPTLLGWLVALTCYQPFFQLLTDR